MENGRGKRRKQHEVGEGRGSEERKRKGRVGKRGKKKMGEETRRKIGKRG